MASAQRTHAVTATQAIGNEKDAMIHGAAILPGHVAVSEGVKPQYQVLPMSLNSSVTDEYEPDRTRPFRPFWVDCQKGLALSEAGRKPLTFIREADLNKRF